MGLVQYSAATNIISKRTIVRCTTGIWNVEEGSRIGAMEHGVVEEVHKVSSCRGVFVDSDIWWIVIHGGI